MDIEQILQEGGEGLHDLLNESDSTGDSGQGNEPAGDINDESMAEEAGDEDSQSDESGESAEGAEDEAGQEDDRLSALERENESMRKRIDQLVAQNHQNKDKAKRAASQVAELNAKISPESPWEADPEYVQGAQEHKNFQSMLDDLGDLYETFADDPDAARQQARGKPYERSLQGTEVQVRKNLRAVMNGLQSQMLDSARKLGVIEDRYQRKAEARNREIAQVVEQAFKFIDDPQDPKHEVAEKFKENFSHLSSLPEFDFFIGALTEFAVSQATARASQGQSPAGVQAKPKPAQRQGSIPKTGATGRGAGAVTKTDDKFTQAVGALKGKASVTDDDLAELLSQFD